MESPYRATCSWNHDDNFTLYKLMNSLSQAGCLLLLFLFPLPSPSLHDHSHSYCYLPTELSPQYVSYCSCTTRLEHGVPICYAPLNFPQVLFILILIHILTGSDDVFFEKFVTNAIWLVSIEQIIPSLFWIHAEDNAQLQYNGSITSASTVTILPCTTATTAYQNETSHYHYCM